MKKFSLFLMIVLIVGAFFISCSAEPANDSSVATVALSLDTAKELSVYTAVENLPDADTLYWYYTATKRNGGFTTGATGETLTHIRADGASGLPSLIGYDGTANSGTWFSTGDWTFSFYGYKLSDLSDENNVLVYQKTGYELEVKPATETNTIGATASITLELKNDPRSGSTFEIGGVIFVKLGTAYESDASYKLKAYVDGNVVKNGDEDMIIEGGDGDGEQYEYGDVTFTTAQVLKTFAKNDNGMNGLHLVEFKMYKDNDTETVYASGEIGLIARMGYTYGIYGELDSLESRAQVGINANLPENLDSANQTITELTISNESQLRAFASYVNQGNDCADMTINLANDILLTQPWTPIGNGYRGETNPKVFSGIFNGNSKTITGLTSVGYSVNPASETDSAEYTYGLFGYVKGGTIEHVKLESVTIAGGSALENGGAVVGYLDGGTVNDCHVLSGSISGFNGIGGVVGRAYGTVTITGCANDAEVTGSKNVAGIVGFANPTATDKTVTITGNTNTGAVTRNTTNGDAGTAGAAAGIVCYGTGSATDKTGTVTITENENHGEITDTTSRTADIAYITSYYDGTNVDVQN